MNKARKIADMAIFTAIGVVLNMMSFSSFGLFLGRMSLVYAFCYMVGILYGPLSGACIAMVADLLPAIILPQEGLPPNMLINIGIGLMAFIMGVCVHYKKGNFNLKFAIGVILSFIVVTLGINSFGETFFFGMRPYTLARLIGDTLNIENPYLLIMLSKVVTQPFWIVLNSSLVYVIVYKLRNIISFRYDLNFFDKKAEIQIEE